MEPLEAIAAEAKKLPYQQLRELLAMAKGMQAANEIRKKEEQKEKK